MRITPTDTAAARYRLEAGSGRNVAYLFPAGPMVDPEDVDAPTTAAGDLAGVYSTARRISVHADELATALVVLDPLTGPTGHVVADLLAGLRDALAGCEEVMRQITIAAGRCTCGTNGQACTLHDPF